jgi:phenylalanyl-tRNA synthetase beta chain
LLPGALEYFTEAAGPVRIFEVGETFAYQEAIVERSMLAFGFSADPIEEPSWRDSEFLRLKGDGEHLLRRLTGRAPQVAPGARAGFHPGKTAVLSLKGREVGYLGKIDPRLAKRSDLRRNAYLCVVDICALPAYETPSYSPPSRYPSTYRDLALIVGVDVTAGAIEAAVGSELGRPCTNVRVFDEYRGPQIGEGRKSLAVRVTLQRFDATITDEEADAAIARLLDAMRAQFGAEIRT